MMKIKINPKYEQMREWIEKIPSVFATEGKTIHDSRNILKIFKAPDGSLFNVKQYHKTAGPNLLVYSWGIRKPKGQRAYEYPFILQDKGINTPEAIAYIEERNCGFLGLSWFISRQCDYGHTMYEFGNAEEGTYEEFAVAFGRFTASLHEKGVLHLDYSPGNILWQKDEHGYHFCIVDINRMHFGPVDEATGLKNLKRLWGPKRFFLLITDAYAETRHINRQAAEAVALKARAGFWLKFQKKHPVKFKLEL